MIGLQTAKQLLEKHRDMFFLDEDGKKLYMNRINLERVQGLEIGLNQGLNYKTTYNLDLPLKDQMTVK